VPRAKREEAEDIILSPGATRALGAGHRALPEEPDYFRTCFERDLHRIVHTTAFRRLAGKCQVFIAPNDPHLRTRLTHSLEVNQIARGLSNALGLNTSLTEAIALGHDCGHGPGGHAAETALEIYVPGGFDHALWGANVTLAPLNLCQETLDGIRQHSWRLSAPSTPEGEVVSWADRIGYVTHDYNDAVREGIVESADLPRSVRELGGTTQSSQIRAFVRAMVETAERTGKLGMSSDAASALDDFRVFNYEHIYLRPDSMATHANLVATLRALVEYYAAHPWDVPDNQVGYVDVSDSELSVHNAVAYVVGMTDRFALERYTELEL
jgi:dGTPase